MIAGIVLVCYGLQISCTSDQPFDKIAKVTIQIPLPETDNLKSTKSISAVAGVTVTVTTGDEILAEEELSVSGNTASGTVVISPGENITFTVEARDEEDIVQWQGSTTLDVVDDFAVDLVLEPILPMATVLQASKAENSVNLSWTQSSDNDFGRYELHRSASENDLGDNLYSTTAIDETQFNDTLIVEGQSFFYTLIVFDTEDFSASSNVAQVDLPIIYPMPISLFLISNDSNRVRLSWTQNTDNDFAGYELQRSLSEGEPGAVIFSSSIATDTLFEDIRVEEGISYFYTCLATDTAGNSTSSNQIQVRMPIINPTPSILEAAYNDMIYLSWAENPDPDFASYELYRSRTGDDPWENIHSTSDITETDFIDETAMAGNTYYYKVIVFDTDGLSAESNVVQIEVPGTPPTPVYLEGFAEGDYSYLYWEESIDKDFERYDVYRSQTKNLWGQRVYTFHEVSDTYFFDEEAREGNTYYYRVIVYDTEKLYSESNVVEVILNPYPPNPVKLAGAYQMVDSVMMIQLSWSENNDWDFDYYELYRSDKDNDIGISIFSTYDNTITYYEDTDIGFNSTFYYTLVVYDKSGLSTNSNVVQVSTLYFNYSVEP